MPAKGIAGMARSYEAPESRSQVIRPKGCTAFAWLITGLSDTHHALYRPKLAALSTVVHRTNGAEETARAQQQ
jgi:hypothetical protein